jgi:hypothetical protein
MRFHEFADPKEYTPSATDAEDFFQQLPRIWPDRSVNNLPPFVPIKQPPARPR